MYSPGRQRPRVAEVASHLNRRRDRDGNEEVLLIVMSLEVEAWEAEEESNAMMDELRSCCPELPVLSRAHAPHPTAAVAACVAVAAGMETQGTREKGSCFPNEVRMVPPLTDDAVLLVLEDNMPKVDLSKTTGSNCLP